MKKILKISIFFLFVFVVFNINSKSYASINDVKVTYTSSFTYTGNPITPLVTVKNKNGKILKKGTDYSVSYSNNKNVGTGKIIIKGLKKQFSGQITKTFSIKRKSIKGYKNNVSLSQREFVYSSVSRKPSIYIKGLKSSDYKVVYFNTVNVGTGRMVITGIGNYTDSITEYFKIKRRNIRDCAIYLDNKTYTYTGSQIKPKISKVSLGTYILKLNKDYTLKYSNNINAGTGKIQFTGIGNFTGTVTKTFTIQRKNISVSPKIKKTTYKNIGKIIQFPVDVYISNNNKKLVKDKDYTLTYFCKLKDNKYYYSVSINGKGNYKFHWIKEFSTSKKNSTITIGI